MNQHRRAKAARSQLVDELVRGSTATRIHLGCVGSGDAFDSTEPPSTNLLAAGIAARAILAARVKPQVTGLILAAVGVAAAHRDQPSPVPVALAIVQSSLGEALGSDHAATLLVTTAESLEDPDRADLQQLLFRISPTNPADPGGS